MQFCSFVLLRAPPSARLPGCLPGCLLGCLPGGRATSLTRAVTSYYNGDDATILVSKSAGRYRIQAGRLEALWLVGALRRCNYDAGTPVFTRCIVRP